jgi:hypothetical protein
MWIFSQALVSCGSDDDEGTACEPNVLRACSGTGQCEGLQTCAADGSGYSECACEGSGSAGSAGAGGSGAGGSANAGGGAAGTGAAPVEALFPTALRAIGSPCASDDECPTGPNGEAPLVCVTAAEPDIFGAGGPQGGYCTAPCRTQEDCPALDALSGCALRDAAGDGYCVSLCQAGDGGVKCNGPAATEETLRAQACLPPGAASTNNIGVCIPVCQSDADCGAGLFCNQDVSGAGLCSATAPVGGDIGAACTTETSATDCKSGFCLGLGSEPPASFCSSVCTFGLFESGCGFTPASGVPQEAYCAQPTAIDGAPGDLGFCVELCDEASDCGQAGWLCAELLPEGQVLLGRQGECVPPGTVLPDDPDAVTPDAGAP